MAIEDAILYKVRRLPPEKQQALLKFADSLDAAARPQSLRSPEGLWADLNIDISEEDIDEVRRDSGQTKPTVGGRCPSGTGDRH